MGRGYDEISQNWNSTPVLSSRIIFPPLAQKIIKHTLVYFPMLNSAQSEQGY